MTRERELWEALLPYKPKIETKLDLKRTRDDWRIFGGWYTILKLRKKFKYSRDEILTTFLIPCLRELIREGSTEFHPENWKKYPKEIYLEAFDKVVTKFRYLVKPHGEAIWKKRKKATVHARRFIQGNFFSIVEGDKEFGFARFEEGKKINLEEFRALKREHFVSDFERKQWWPKADVLYFYKLRTWIPFGIPRKVSVPKGIQTYGARKSLKESDIKDFEYLTHHLDVNKTGKEEVHHCFFYDHLGNLYAQDHLLVKKGEVFIDGKKIAEGLYHFIIGLEEKQEVTWSDEEAEKAGIRPKKMKGGMTLQQKAREW